MRWCSEKLLHWQRKMPVKGLDSVVPALVIARRWLNPFLGASSMGRGLLLWLLGIPIPVIILLYVFHVI